MARSDAKLKNLPRETLEELWDLKYPADPEQKALGLLDLLPVIADQYKIEIGKSALAEFYQWLKLQRRMWARESAAEQFKEFLAKDTTLTPEQLKAAGQRLFMADGILEKDVKAFALAATLENDDIRLKQKDREIELRKEANRIARDRLTAATRSKIDAGLDALFEEIQGNPRAVELFNQIKEIVRKA